MKKLLFFLLPLAALALSCKEVPPEPVQPVEQPEKPVPVEEVKLQIVVADEAFRSLKAGESLQVGYEVKTPQGVTYTLMSFQPEGWDVVLSTPSGNKGTLTVSLPADAGTGRIMLVANGSDGSCFVKVLGVGVGSTGTVHAYEAVDASGGSLELPSGSGTIRITASGGDWINVNGLRLVLSENTTYESREALVRFTVDKQDCELTVVQAQKDAIVLTADALEALPEGEILQFVVRANVEVEARCDADWLSLAAATKGMEDKPFNITVSPNETEETRSAVVSFTSGDLLQEVTLTQAPLPPLVSGDFLLLTDASILEPGDQLLVVNPKGTMAMGAQNGTYRTPVSITPEYDIIRNPGRGVAVITLGGTPGAWEFGVTDGYLSAQSEAKSQLLTVETLSDYARWTIEVADDGTAVVKSLEGSRNRLCYNMRDMRFCCYLASSSNIVDVVLYHKPAVGKSITDNEDPGIYLGGRNKRIYERGTDQQVRSWTGGRLSYVLVNPDSREQLAVEGYGEGFSQGESVKIRVLWKSGWDVLLDKEYVFVLQKEENGKVWLGNEAGQGVIIKK